jgi:hypothetical protein
MARYVVEWNDRCGACGAHAAVVYEQERPAPGNRGRAVRRHVECTNPGCARHGGDAAS